MIDEARAESDYRYELLRNFLGDDFRQYVLQAGGRAPPAPRAGRSAGSDPSARSAGPSAGSDPSAGAAFAPPQPAPGAAWQAGAQAPIPPWEARAPAAAPAASAVIGVPSGSEEETRRGEEVKCCMFPECSKRIWCCFTQDQQHEFPRCLEAQGWRVSSSKKKNKPKSRYCPDCAVIHLRELTREEADKEFPHWFNCEHYGDV